MLTDNSSIYFESSNKLLDKGKKRHTLPAILNGYLPAKLLAVFAKIQALKYGDLFQRGTPNGNDDPDWP